MKNRVLISETTREERSVIAARAVGTCMEEAPELCNLIEAIYQYYVDGRLELTQVKQFIIMFHICTSQQPMDMKHTDRLAAALMRNLEKSCRDRLYA